MLLFCYITWFFLRSIVGQYQIKFLEIGTDDDHVHFWFSLFRRIQSQSL